jgi:CCDC81-like prokaryotic HU domain 1/SPOR domain
VKIQTLIKSLLISNDKLSIPELGSFVSKHKSAEIDDKTGDITPPTKEISFDETLKDDDGLLFNALLGHKLTEEEARKELELLKITILKTTTSKEKYKITGFGFLIKNDKGELVFKTTATDSLLPENVGLSPVSFNPDELNKIKTTKEKTKKEKVKKEKIKTTKPPKVKTEKDKQKSKKVMKGFLIAVPIIAIIVLLGLFHKPIIEKGKELFSNLKDTTTTQDIVDVDTTEIINNNNNNTPDELGNDKEYLKLLNSKITNTADINLGTEYKKFYIIVGSFSMKENANKYKDELRGQNYDASVISGDHFRVAIGGFNTADNLIAEYNKIKSKYGENVWILINR